MKKMGTLICVLCLMPANAFARGHITALRAGFANMLGKQIAAGDLATEVLAGGMSGDVVYKVKVAGTHYVAKFGLSEEPLERWQQATTIQTLAGIKGLAPRVFYSAQEDRLVISELIDGKPLVDRYFNETTRQDALHSLVAKLKAVHGLSVQASMRAPDVVAYTHQFATKVLSEPATPRFVGEVYKRFLTTAPPLNTHKDIVGHNDLNPNNVLFDRKGVQFIDWAASGLASPYYDLATLANFYLMSEAEAKDLLALYLGKAGSDNELAELKYYRTTNYVFNGMIIIAAVGPQGLSHHAKDTLASIPSLADVYQLVGQGKVNLNRDAGRLVMALALIKEASQILP